LSPQSIPGAALQLSYRGQHLLELGLGLADKATGRQVQPRDTLFRLGSVSKLFPALLLFQLAEQGAVGLEQAVASAQPAFQPINPFDGSAITFRSLASQLSGLQREVPFGVSSTEEAMAAISATYLILPPGQRPSYSNLGYAVLGHVLAESVAPAHNASLPSELPLLVQQLITAPLGMGDTGFNYSSSGVSTRLAQGYDASGASVPFAELGWMFPAGSMYGSVADLGRLGSALLQAAGSGDSSGGPLALSAASARELLGPVFWNRDGASLMGCPWEMHVSGSYLVASKGGNLPGYSTSLSLVPQLNLSLAVAWNGGADEISWVDAALDALLPALAAELSALQPSPAFSPGPEPADYTGNYSMSGGGGYVLVRQQEGLLLWFSSALGLQVELDWFKSDVELGDMFRVAFSDDSFSCLLGELEALRFQYVLFQRDCDSGSVVSTAVPGWVPGALWTRPPANASAGSNVGPRIRGCR
jgi:CubicO group peptidase (beta-lactamase class C family)